MNPMEQSGVNEILNALKLHSSHFDQKLDQMKDQLESRAWKTHGSSFRPSRIDHLRTHLSETQETVDFLSIKNAQHERKIREIYNQQQS